MTTSRLLGKTLFLAPPMENTWDLKNIQVFSPITKNNQECGILSCSSKLVTYA